MYAHNTVPRTAQGLTITYGADSCRVEAPMPAKIPKYSCILPPMHLHMQKQTQLRYVRICDIRPSKGKQALDVYNLQVN